MTRPQAVCAVLLAILGGASTRAETIGVRTLALRPGDLPEVHLKVAKGFEKLRFSSVQPTEPVRALQADPLPLYRAGKDAEGKDAFVVAETVKVPGGARGILLLGWTAGGETRYAAIRDDFGSARYSDWLLINASKSPVAFKVGETGKPVMVKAGASETYRISAAKGQGATVLAQAPINGRTKVFFSTYWPIHEDRRTVVLFLDDGRRIRVKRISDKLASSKRPAAS